MSRGGKGCLRQRLMWQRDVQRWRKTDGRREGEKWRVARWNSALKVLTVCRRNIFGELFMIGVCVCFVVLYG